MVGHVGQVRFGRSDVDLLDRFTGGEVYRPPLAGQEADVDDLPRQGMANGKDFG